MAKRLHDQPRHPHSKKYTRYAYYTTEDLEKQILSFAHTSCRLHNPGVRPYGRMRGDVWYIMQDYYTTNKGVRRRKETRVVEVLFEAYLERPFTSKEQIHQCCKTKGCLNPHHYELRGDRVMVNYDQVITMFEQAILRGELIIPLNDPVQARAMRLACYPHKRTMKVKNPQLYEQIHEVYELVIRKGNLVCRKKGFSSDIQDAWAAAGLPSQSNASKEKEQLSRAMNQLREQEAAGAFDADPMTTLLNKQKEERGNPPTDSKEEKA